MHTSINPLPLCFVLNVEKPSVGKGKRNWLGKGKVIDPKSNGNFNG